MAEPKFEIPNIPIKITREGDKVKFVVGKYQLKLNQLPNEKSQSYDFVTLEQFITNSAQLIYQDIIEADRVLKDLKSADEWDKKHGTNSTANNRTKNTLSPGE